MSGSSRGVLGCWVSPRLVEYPLQVLQALVTFPHTGPRQRTSALLGQRALMPRHWLDCVGKTWLASDQSRRPPARQQISAIAPIQGAASKMAISRAVTSSSTLAVCARSGTGATPMPLGVLCAGASARPIG